VPKSQDEMKALLQERVAFYAADPVGRRAVVPDSEDHYLADCMYRTEDGARTCFIGGMLTEQELQTLEDEDMRSDALHNVIDYLPSLAEWSEKFLFDCQNFHDIDKYWDEKGLTSDGKDVLQNLFNRIEAGCYDA
jgi:hypothetical protein